MLIPKSFKLVNRTWKVRVVSRLKMLAESHEDARVEPDPEWAHRGLCDPYTATIYLREDQSTDDMLHSFFHEVGHAMLFATGAFAAKAHNEVLVDQFGALMAQFWSTCKGDQVI